MVDKYFVHARGRWRELDPATGTVSGWRGRARFLVSRRGRLQAARAGAVLRGLYALAVGAPTVVRDAAPLPYHRKRERRGHGRCCCAPRPRAAKRVDAAVQAEPADQQLAQTAHKSKHKPEQKQIPVPAPMQELDVKQEETDSQPCKELIINEDDVEALRNFLQKSNILDVDLEKFDADDDYKSVIFYKINPLVSVERCPRIARLCARRGSERMSLAEFATELGLKAVSGPRVKGRKAGSDKENLSDCDSTIKRSSRAVRHVRRMINKHASTASSDSDDSAFEVRKTRKRSESDSPRRNDSQDKLKSNTNRSDLKKDRQEAKFKDRKHDTLKNKSNNNDSRELVVNQRKLNELDTLLRKRETEYERPKTRMNEMEQLMKENGHVIVSVSESATRQTRNSIRTSLVDKSLRSRNVAKKSISGTTSSESDSSSERVESSRPNKNQVSQSSQKSNKSRSTDKSQSKSHPKRAVSTKSPSASESDSSVRSTSLPNNNKSHLSIRDYLRPRAIKSDSTESETDSPVRNLRSSLPSKSRVSQSPQKPNKSHSRPDKSQNKSRPKITVLTQSGSETDSSVRNTSPNKNRALQSSRNANKLHSGLRDDLRTRTKNSSESESDSPVRNLKSNLPTKSESRVPKTRKDASVSPERRREKRDSESPNRKETHRKASGKAEREGGAEPQAKPASRTAAVKPQPARRSETVLHLSTSKFREYSSLEDQAIVAWISSGSRSRLVNGNRIWRELQPQYARITDVERSWHSLRNRYLRYILPRLQEMALPADKAQQLRAAAAQGEIKSQLRKSKPNPLTTMPTVRSAFGAKPRRRRSTERDDEPEPAEQTEPKAKRQRLRDGSPASLRRLSVTPTYSELTRRFASRLRSTPNSSSRSSPRTPTKTRKLYNPKV